MTRRIGIGLLAALLLTACTAGNDGTYSAPLGAATLQGGGSYSSGGGLDIAADLQERDGRIAVCGVWTETPQQSVLTKRTAADVLATGAIYLGKQKLLQGLRFMRKVAPSAQYAGKEATCRLTNAPWTAAHGARPQIRIPRQEVYRDVSGNSGGTIVIFRPTGPGA